MLRILDPFAGVGGIHYFHEERGDDTIGLELEAEWAGQHPRNVVGDATRPPFPKFSFDAIVTSPCYGNRMADVYDGRDGSTRRTYRISLGRVPSSGSSAVMQWGSTYRGLHERAWRANYALLHAGGLFIVNISNHLRTLKSDDGQIEMHVTEWHMMTLSALGLRLLAAEPVGTARYGFGANGQDRAESEFLLVFRKPSKPEAKAARSDLVSSEQLALL